MTDPSIESKIKAILLDILDVPEEDIAGKANLINDLGASSVDLVELIAGLENEFDLAIGDEAAASMRTFQDVVDYVQSHTD